MRLGLGLTNAHKAAVIAAVTALLALLSAFDVALTDNQQKAIIGVVAAVLGVWGLLTANQSPTLKEGANALTGAQPPPPKSSPRKASARKPTTSKGR